MKQGIEDHLRRLRPGALPDALARRLDAPPRISVSSAAPRMLLGLAAAAALVALAALVAWHQTHSPSTPAQARMDPPAAPAASAARSINAPSDSAPVFAGAHTTEVTDVRPVTVVTDESNRPWRMIEVNWVEEDTYVFADHPAVVRTQDHYRTVVPVALPLD